MTKQTGLGDNLYVAGYDLSGDIGSLSAISGGPKALELTGINKSAMERIGGTRDGALEFSAFFNPSTDQAHERLSALPTADVIVSYLRGTTLGNGAACLVAKQLNYDGSRNEDGSFTFKIEAQANGYGLEWGHQLTAGAHDSTGAEDLTGFDDGAGAATDFGLQAYLQVTEFTGTDMDVVLEDSDDDAATDPYAAITGAAFTTVTGITSERIQTGRTENVKEWIRVAVSGTFTTATLAVVVVRNTTAVVF